MAKVEKRLKCAWCEKALTGKQIRDKAQTCCPEHGYLNRKRKQRADGEPLSKQPSETVELGDKSGVISINRTRNQTLEELVAHCRLDLKEWEIERFVCNKWEVGAKDNDGKIQVEPLFQVKAWLKRRVLRVAVEQEIAALLKHARGAVPRLPDFVRKLSRSTNNMLEISDGEPHLGKLAWAKETSGGSYDMPIATRRVSDSVVSLIQGTSHHKYDEVVYVLGNDWLHIDGRNGQTTAGTQQDFDSRFPKIFQIGWQLAVRQIDLLRQVAPVRVVIVPGNHNVDSSFCMGEVLSVYYAKCKSVTVDNEPKTRKFVKFGTVGLMFCHGDKGSRKFYPLVMAATNRAMWGDTRWSEIHTGHTHQTRVEEQNGVRVRTLPSLTEPDYWHDQSGYVGNIPSAEAFIWSGTDGLLGTANYWARNEKAAA